MKSQVDLLDSRTQGLSDNQSEILALNEEVLDMPWIPFDGQTSSIRDKHKCLAETSHGRIFEFANLDEATHNDQDGHRLAW